MIDNKENKNYPYYTVDDIHDIPPGQTAADPASSYIQNLESTISSDNLSSFDITKETKIPFYNKFDKVGKFVNDWAFIEKEISNEDKLLNEMIQIKKELILLNRNKEKNKKEIISLQLKLREYEKINHITKRINDKGKLEVFKRKELYEKFLLEDEIEMTVMAIDIRKSTDLMLRAKDNSKFADFITQLYTLLGDIIKNNYGVIDKFTGDGLISFFPKFYSGEDFLLYTLLAAENCHSIFKDFYKEYYNYFSPVLSDTGLGIGIDCGNAAFNILYNEIVLIGKPVVYACRLSAGKAGSTILNQNAYQLLNKNFPNCFKIKEKKTKIKDGDIISYRVLSRKVSLLPNMPLWRHNQMSNE